MDNLTEEQRKKNMRHIRSTDTKAELLLRKTLWNKGYRYRKNYSKLPGKPDIALTKYKIAVFCDGEFFHGKDWASQRQNILKSNNSDYWISKIERNIERDHDNDLALKALGWTVIRFWSKDVLADSQKCVETIEEAVLLAKEDCL